MRMSGHEKEIFITNYINICNELIGKTENDYYRNYYIRMAEEAKNYSNFPVITNSVDLILSNWEKLDLKTIQNFIRSFQSLQG